MVGLFATLERLPALAMSYLWMVQIANLSTSSSSQTSTTKFHKRDSPLVEITNMSWPAFATTVVSTLLRLESSSSLYSCVIICISQRSFIVVLCRKSCSFSILVRASQRIRILPPLALVLKLAQPKLVEFLVRK